MKKESILFLIVLLYCTAGIPALAQVNTPAARTSLRASASAIMLVSAIPLPPGFERVALPNGSFGEWLRNFKLKKDNTVRLYNGQPIARQDLHYAVLDLTTGNKDLQQCADAVMRLKAEYYFSLKEYNNIAFPTGNGNTLRFSSFAATHTNGCTHDYLLLFMEKVFTWCGTYTVDDMTTPVQLHAMQPGDVLIKAGAPGHTMIVADVAENKITHQKIYLLAQSFMPAQDMHIVINPADKILSPWYSINEKAPIVTPGWIFTPTQLKRWK